MKRYTTFAKTEALLLTATNLKGRTIKDISVTTDIKLSTIYKWKTTDMRLCPDKADALLLYFIQNEPQRLELAEKFLPLRITLYNNILPLPS